MGAFSKAALIATLVGACVASDVIVGTEDNFAGEIAEGVVVVVFYAPRCSHCKNRMSEWEAAATELKGKAKLIKVDATAETELVTKYGVHKFPTIKVFRNGLDVRWIQGQIKYDGSRTTADIMARVARLSEMLERDVIVGTGYNFAGEIAEGVVVVVFYAPRCRYCKNRMPEWEAAATELKGKAKLIKVDATVQTALVTKYGVQEYPTIKAFIDGRDAMQKKYDGGRTAAGIVAWVSNIVKTHVARDVIVGTGDNFAGEIAESVVVVFYAPRCGDCKKLMPEWGVAATKLKGKAKLIKVDAAVQTELVTKYGVHTFPTIKLFINGRDAMEYDGDLKAADIVAWVRSMTAHAVKAVGTTGSFAVSLLTGLGDMVWCSLPDIVTAANCMYNVGQFLFCLLPSGTKLTRCAVPPVYRIFGSLISSQNQ